MHGRNLTVVEGGFRGNKTKKFIPRRAGDTKPVYTRLGFDGHMHQVSEADVETQQALLAFDVDHISLPSAGAGFHIECAAEVH
ncbi:hypothetical protein Vqi01_12590 [Micromonospora qiuiae]|uniref:Uncharacterized protein n=1 Tax=Micromonospora qiuiae TaxID=502268 RepID=A0ABQ4J7G2_9ACTN|nr:hypothetical protein Vqi01_12590 [Micromonospora qiuiae]